MSPLKLDIIRILVLGVVGCGADPARTPDRRPAVTRLAEGGRAAHDVSGGGLGGQFSLAELIRADEAVTPADQLAFADRTHAAPQKPHGLILGVGAVDRLDGPA